jgi:cell wall-associated NlpC family hydrolase
MENYQIGRYRQIGAILLCLSLLMGNFEARAVDSATLISVSISNATPIMPRTIFTQTWTFQNTGTTTWSPSQSGYTLNPISKDSLGTLSLFTNTASKRYIPSAIIGSGQSVAPGGQATFSLSFIAPETSGSVTDLFQLNSASSVFFGPQVSIQIVVVKAGSTNQYDRSRAISYANNYAGYVVSDSYFWTNGSIYVNYGAFAPVPTAELGDDCAHFISCCIGSQPAQWGGGLKIPSRVPPTYGEPGVARLINTVLLAGGYATEVFSLNDLSPGDLIGWNWEGDTNIADLDHATLYLGNGMLASHSASCLDVAPSFFQNSLPNWRWHLIHILDAPTLGSSMVGNKLVMSWGTNWTGYALYSAPSLSAGTTWNKVANSPGVIGPLNVMTNTMSPGAQFFRLMLHD